VYVIVFKQFLCLKSLTTYFDGVMYYEHIT
jgi:hypothetical protein